MALKPTHGRQSIFISGLFAQSIASLDDAGPVAEFVGIPVAYSHLDRRCHRFVGNAGACSNVCAGEVESLLEFVRAIASWSMISPPSPPRTE
jgi:hypothetical protein